MSEETKEAAPAAKSELDRSGTGMVLGVIVFLAGVGLLLLTFKLAYDMFTTPPVEALQIGKDSIDFSKVGPNLIGIVVKVLLLIVMGVMGSLVANRGVTLFTGSRAQRR